MDQGLWRRSGLAFMEKECEFYEGDTTKTQDLYFHFFHNKCLKEEEMGHCALQTCDALGIAKSMMEGGWIEATRNVHYPQGRLRVPGGPHRSSLLTPHVVCLYFALREERGLMSLYTLSWASRPALSWPDIKCWRPQGC